ncbi:MAG TPA: DUF4410 domain-containing protein [Pseudomonadales bacterium]|nr:DUF4410 domain-containing protein [Pseudomonadales bacterium]
MKLKPIFCIGGLLGMLAAGCSSDDSANLPTSSENPVQKIVAGSANVQTIASYQGPEPLAKPRGIVIDDFVVPPDAVTPDSSAAERIHQRHEFLLGVIEGKSKSQSPEEQVQASFGETLVDELKKTSLSTERFTGTSIASLPTNTLVIQGQFTTINEGNRSARIMIGFGRGASDVQAQVAVLLTTKGQPIVLSQFTVDSASGDKPGAVAGMGAAGVHAATTAATVSAGSAGQGSATVVGDAARMAREVARQIEKVMTDQKWITTQPEPDSK